MLHQCFKKGCEFEVDYICDCLSLQTYWCQFHLGEHLKLSNRTHTFDTVIAEPSQETNDSIFDFLEKEKSKIEKLKEIVLASLSPKLYNSKISIEETLKRLDYSLKEINTEIQEITKSLKKRKGFNIKQLNNSELYNARLCFRLNQLKSKRSKILKISSNEPNAEKDFRRTCWLYENSYSDPSLYQAYHDYLEVHDKLTSLFLIDDNADQKTNLYIYSTESESEKVLDIQQERYIRARIIQLPNGKLLYWSGYLEAFIIDINYKFRRLPSWKAENSTSVIYFNRSIYCFGGKADGRNSSIRFDLEKNIWIKLSPTIKTYYKCSSVIFKGNILIIGYDNSNIFLYSVDIDSISEIPCEFKKNRSKILIKGEKRLYLIEFNSGSIFESEVDDEYTWKWIARSIIDAASSYQIYCSYNKGGIYISIYHESNTRQYFKFDLDQKTLIEIAFYNKYIAIKRNSRKHWNIECYSQTFKFEPDDAMAYISKGNSLYDLGNLLDEIERLNNEIKLDPSYNPDKHYKEKGDALCKLGRNIEAIECFNQVIKLKPSDKYAYSKKSQILYEEDNEVEAINCHNEAIMNNPYNINFYINKGYTLWKIRRCFEAIECYNEAIKLDPKSLQAYLYKGEALSSLDRKSEAIECYNEAIKIDPKDANAYFYKGEVLSELGRDFELIEFYNEAIKLNPSEARFYMLKGKALSQMGLNIEKNECYKEVIKNFSGVSKAYFREAFIECDLESKNEALELYNKKIESHPFNVEAYIRKGYALYNLNRKIEAIKCWNKLFKIDPKNKIKYIKDILNESNYYNLFETCIENDKVGIMNEDGLHFLDWIIELIERYSELIEMKTYYAYAYALKGCTLHLSGKYLEEIECYNKAIAINPNDANIYFAKNDTLHKVERKI